MSGYLNTKNLQNLLDGYNVAIGNKTTGGNITGGYIATSSYGGSHPDVEKEKLIRNITTIMQNTLKLKGDTTNLSISELVRALKNTIPEDPNDMNKNSPLFKDSNALKEMLTNLFKSLTDAGLDVELDMNKPHESLDKILEATTTITGGVRSEFVSVAKDVRTSLHNLYVLKNSLKTSFDTIMAVIGKSDDSATKTQAESINMIYNSLIDVLDKQINILANTLNMQIDPTTAIIAEMSETDSEWKGYIQKLKKNIGVTSHLGHRLAFTLSGLKHSAVMANEVNLALKQIGASVSDYKDHSKSLKNLESHLTKVWEHHYNKPTMDDVAKLMASLDIIRSNYYNHDDIIKELTNKKNDIVAKRLKKKGGESGLNDIGAAPWSTGGGNVSCYSGGSRSGLNDMGTRMKNQKTFRTLLLRDFKRRLEEHSQTLARAVESLGKQLGKSIPLDDNLEGFKNAFRVLADDSVNRVNFYMAVSGYNTDARSKDERARFLGNLKSARRATQPLLQNAATKNYFGVVAKSLDELVSFIEGFSDKYLKPMSELLVKTPDITNISTNIGDGKSLNDIGGGKRGKGKPVKPSKKEETEELENTVELEEPMVTTGNEVSVEVSVEGGDSGTDYHFVSLQRVAHELNFYHGVAKMRDNLKGVASQIESASEDYTNISGEAIGDLVVTVKKNHNAWLKDFEDKTTAGSMGKWLEDNWLEKTVKPEDVGIYYSSNTSPANPISVETYVNPQQWKQQVVSNIKQFKKLQVECKINLYKTAEAIDLYLIQFANAIAADPGSIRSLFDITKELDAIAHWYTSKSGAHLARLFESMPYNKDGSGQYVNADVDSDFALNSDHYYNQVKNMLTNQTGIKKGLGNPFLSMLCGATKTTNELEELLKKAKSATVQVRVLDNIVKLFAQAGNKIAGKDLDQEQYMPLEMIKQNLSNYIFMSAFTMGINESSKVSFDETRYSTSAVNGTVNPNLTNKVRADSGGGLMKVGFNMGPVAPATDTLNWFSQQYGISMRPIEGKYDCFNKEFSLDDKFFVMIIKSMMAKVFTVISAYGVTNKPLEKYNSISNARQIMGGSKTGGAGALDSIPEVIPEATELYIRLPLLAEFYREILKFEDVSNNAADTTKVISMVPEMNDVWQDLIKIVFDEAKHVSEGTYSENQVRRLIRAINDIYRKYKTSDDKKTITSAINAFVAEINRRYGVVEQRYINTYIKDRKSRHDSKKYNEDETPDYDLLDKNASGSHSRKPLPSDRFDTVVGESKIDVKHKFDATEGPDWITVVRNFRSKIDREICMYKPGSMDFSFSNTVIQQKRKISGGKDNAQRYGDVLKAIQSSDQLNNVNHYKSLMFQEAVVSPLATCYVLYTLLQKFCDKAKELDLVELEHQIKTAYNSGDNDNLDAIINPANNKLINMSRDVDVVGTDPAGNDAMGTATFGLGVFAPLNKPVGNNGRDAELCVQFLQRYMIDRNLAFKELVELVWGIGSDLSDLVSIKIESNHIICDFSKLTEYIIYTMRSVKASLEKFRNVVGVNVIRLYEGGVDSDSRDGNENPASIYWLEENLVDKLLKDRDEDGLNRANERLAGCYSSLKRKWDVSALLNGTGIPHDLDQDPVLDGRLLQQLKDDDVSIAWEDHLQSSRQHSVDNAMEELVYWNSEWTALKSAGYNGNNDIQEWPFAILPKSKDLTDKDDAEDAARLKMLETAFTNVLTNYVKLPDAVRLNLAAGTKDNTANNPYAAYNTAVDKYLAVVNENKYLSIVRGRMMWYSNGKNNDWVKMKNSGLLVDLNQTLSYYLKSCYDPSMKKMYSPLVKHFGEGSNAAEIMNGQALDDLTDYSQALSANLLGVPTKGSVIFASLAQVVRNVLQSRKNNASKDFRYRSDSLMEVPDHIKENLRGCLPAFVKMFEAVKVKSDILRRFVQQLDTTRFSDATLVAAGNLDNKTQFLHPSSNTVFNGPDVTTSDVRFEKGTGVSASDINDNGKTRSPLFMWGTANNKRMGTSGHPNVCVPYDPRLPGDCDSQREFYTSLLDNIKSAAQSLQKCANGVYEELGDINPRYAELYEGFIEDYSESNKHEPIMPLSLMQIGLRNRENGDSEKTYAVESFMLPFYKSKENPHKLNYGARKVFSSLRSSTDPDPNFDLLHGPKVIMDGYNAISSADTRFDEGAYEKSCGAHAVLLRYVLDTRNTRACYALKTDPGESYSDVSLTNTPPTGSKTNWKNSYRPYSMQNELSRVISLVESSDVDTAIREMNKSISVDIKDINKRSQARIYNLIDMSIVPINVHAMMRDVPLINLINYSYTFDRMVQEHLLPDNCDLMEEHHKCNTSTQLLNKLILHPYCDITDATNHSGEYDSLFHRLMTGDSGLGLGRPKYLSDQVYNTVLFRDLFRMPKNTTVVDDGRPDESGPSASSAQQRLQRNDTLKFNGQNLNLDGFEGNITTLQYLRKDNMTNPEHWKEGNDTVRNPNKIRRPNLEVVDVSLPASMLGKLRDGIGKLRFDTILVRNLMFLVNVQRLCRKMMRDELSYIETPVISGNKPTRNLDYLSENMTEYNANEDVEDHENQFHYRRRAVPNPKYK